MPGTSASARDVPGTYAYRGMSSPLPTREQVLTALAGVNDPEIGRPITELGMVKSVEIGADGRSPSAST